MIKDWLQENKVKQLALMVIGQVLWWEGHRYNNPCYNFEKWGKGLHIAYVEDPLNESIYEEFLLQDFSAELQDRLESEYLSLRTDKSILSAHQVVQDILVLLALLTEKTYLEHIMIKEPTKSEIMSVYRILLLHTVQQDLGLLDNIKGEIHLGFGSLIQAESWVVANNAIATQYGGAGYYLAGVLND